MEKRNLIQKIFGEKKRPQKILSQYKMMNGFAPVFSLFDGNVLKSDVWQTAVQAHARHFSKLIPKAIIERNKKVLDGDKNLNRLLGLRPNELMTTSVFLEKCAFQYYNYNNVFIYVKRNQLGEVDSFWVIDAQSITPKGDSTNELYFEFQFGNGKVTVPYFDLIHIQRNINNSEFLGGNNQAMKQVLSLIDTNYQGIEKAIKLSAFIRFIVEYTTPLNEEKKTEKAQQFRDLFLKNGEEEMGVVIAGGTEKITQLKSDAKYSNVAEMKLFDEKVYDYLSINKQIINCTYDENTWQSYYESAVEPFIIKLTQEMTYKLFTTEDFSKGNKIIVQVDKLQYANFATRIKMLQETRETGDLTINERRELLYLPPVKDGDVREVSLNYVVAGNEKKMEVKKENDN